MAGKNLILYGTGEIGKKIVEKMNKNKIPVTCLCDADPYKRGMYVSGVIVKSIDEVKAQYRKGEYTIFVSIGFPNSLLVKNELISQGVFDASDFYDDYIDRFIIDNLPNKENNGNSDYYISAVEKNFIQLDNKRENTLKEFLLATGFNMRTEEDKNNFHEHFLRRLDGFRKTTSPWLESIRPIKNSKILEIGCGTGAFTVSLCEQGANVTAIDLDEKSMETARKRLSIYGLRAEIVKLNAVDIKTRFRGGFDFIIYSASMEHMTYTERIQTIKAAYEMLGDNQYIVLVGIPNRLWHTDAHTSLEPFFHWLPDELAMDYAKFTSRKGFNNGFDKDSEDDLLRFARWGRGVSYHEFEVAVGNGKLKSVSNMNDFLGFPSDYFRMHLKINGPQHIDDGFYEATLNIALAKNT